MSRSENKYFLNWDESANSVITEVGGKGQNLDFLQQNNLTESIHATGAIRAEEALENEEQKA